MVGSLGIHFDTDEEIFSALRNGQIDAVIWEISHRMPVRLDPMPWVVREAVRRIPLLLLIESTSAALNEVIGMASKASHLQVSIIGFGALGREVKAFTGKPRERCAEQSIIQLVLPHIEGRLAREIVVVAAIAGKRRMETRTLALMCGISQRTLHHRLREASLPTARGLLQWMMVLHTAWRREVFGWNVKRSALEGGFSTSAALSNAIFRTAQLRPTALGHGHFESLTAMLVTEMHCGRGPRGRRGLRPAAPARIVT
jgi:hypothetical protein